MKIKDLKIAISSLDDETEVTKELLHSFTKPNWAKGKTLWIEWKDNDSFDDAWLRITNGKLTDTLQKSCIDKWNDCRASYHKMKNEFVIVTSMSGWSIQEDPTFIKVEQIYIKPITQSEALAILTPIYNSLSENQKNEISDFFVKVAKQ